MEYGALLQRAWRLTWQHRFLWILGLFAASSGVSCAGSGGGGGDVQELDDALGGPSPELDQLGRQLGVWLQENLGLIVLVAGLLLLLGLGFLVLSLIAQGGLTRASADLALGRPSSLGAAWRAGLGTFWRYAGLWLTLLGLGLLVAAVVVILAVLAVLAVQASGNPPALVAGLVILAILLALGVGLPIGVLASIVVTLALRAIALEAIGPVASLREGARLLRARPGACLMVWLLALAVSIAGGIALAIGALIVAVPLAILGFLLWLGTSSPPVVIAFAVVAGLVLLLVLLLLSGWLNAYIWTYWTLAYLRLQDRLDRQLNPQAV